VTTIVEYGVFIIDSEFVNGRVSRVFDISNIGVFLVVISLKNPAIACWRLNGVLQIYSEWLPTSITLDDPSSSVVDHRKLQLCIVMWVTAMWAFCGVILALGLEKV
jgi:hypothetical protein